MNYIGIADIDDRLVGLDQWRAAAANSAAEYDDNKILSYLPAWTRRFERDTTMRLSPVQVVSAPDGTYNTPTPGVGTISSNGAEIIGVGTTFKSTFPVGSILTVGSITSTQYLSFISQVYNGVQMEVQSVTDDTHLTLVDIPPVWENVAYGQFPMPVIQETGYPYYQPLVDEYFLTTFNERPVQAVQRFRLMYNGQYIIYNIPSNWFSLNTKAGRFWLMPNFGEAVITGAMATLALIGAMVTDHMPNFLFFDYQAGLPAQWQYNREYSDVKQILSEYCALQVLNDISHAIDAGRMSKSVAGSGISQQTQYSRFMDRKKELQDSVDAFKGTLVMQETPFMLGAV